MVRLFPYGVSRSRLERAIRTLRVPAQIVGNVKDADAIIALKANYRKEPAKLQEGISRNIPTYVIKSNTYVQIETVLREIFRMPQEQPSEEDQAVQQAEEAIEELLSEENQRPQLPGTGPAELVPAPPAAPDRREPQPGLREHRHRAEPPRPDQPAVAPHGGTCPSGG